MAELPQLSRKEWETAMAMVLSDEVSIDPTEKWNAVMGFGNKGNTQGGAKTTTEIPNSHPADGGPVTPEGEKDDEIPAGGGFTTKPSKTPEAGPTSKEIPADGPASSDSPADKPDKAPNTLSWNVKVGKPEPTGKPSGSFAQLNDLQYDGPAWTSKGSMGNQAGAKVSYWSGMPAGTSDGSGASKTPDKWGTPDANSGERMGSRIAGISKTDPKPKTSMAAKDAGKSDDDDDDDVKKGKNGKPLPPWLQKKASKADEDLDKDLPDNLSLPDGSFFTQNVDDLKNNIEKVQNADQTNPRSSTHPWYLDIKRHLMNRASDLGATHMIPADWNLSMGHLET